MIFIYGKRDVFTYFKTSLFLIFYYYFNNSISSSNSDSGSIE
ncbi:MAG: hypothetical protein G01um101418_702 [Parcubacteria group bacterium Gr01-1014_18]|nr:MAG: hypothetical protein Greene041636_844 [Parcubacteria group bacterium Greene0416_36]TSC80283.1 MAG: hypothetical protein G01um101418_702 [Parcubacteria group bacterium Gr01-1014_18]TSC98262.1 MAG: hypothetical protein Greene101420_855 [Parcubacteria group bacterium Greene1014_20]TSD06995.1 MAG: hypothetical protein Greene07142_452 [Parcubacteria group bacterium Greene0714_2]